ncbi:MAG TPA: DUF6804 family protein [Candidatus Paceibacterota bacterium]
MLAPRTRIILVRSTVGLTGLFLLIAALGISTNFQVLKLIITTGFIVLAILSLLMNYRDLGIAGLLLAVLFNPFIPIVLPRHIWVVIDIVTLAGIVYYTYWTTNPYWKGTRFEQYVSTLFPEPDFVIQDRTRDVSKFLNRRVESDTHPDFLFRNQKTGKSFAVECKWRGKWAQGSSGELGLWWNKAQGNRYNTYQKESGIPVFVALGIGGSPEKPQEVYFLESDRLGYTFLKQSLVRSGRASPQL